MRIYSLKIVFNTLNKCKFNNVIQKMSDWVSDLGAKEHLINIKNTLIGYH